ncbi:MAG: preprotein translocase subunit SecE [Gammaproteobacteria bacterium]|nr:preprotein translocase subunit SecE [Gammaproteobacteria bacterium]
MNANTEPSVSPFDRVKLFVAGLLVIGGLFAYYYFAAEYSQVYRVVGVLVATILGFAIAMSSDPGRRFWRFAQGSRIELRKVIWPTRQEALQTTLAVIVFVIVMGVFFWVLDLFLLWATQVLTGRGT